MQLSSGKRVLVALFGLLSFSHPLSLFSLSLQKRENAKEMIHVTSFSSPNRVPFEFFFNELSKSNLWKSGSSYGNLERRTIWATRRLLRVDSRVSFLHFCVFFFLCVCIVFSVYLCICVCVYVCMCVCVYVCMCMCVCVYVCMCFFFVFF
jgi:hypothetical protein